MRRLLNPGKRPRPTWHRCATRCWVRCTQAARSSFAPPTARCGGGHGPGYRANATLAATLAGVADPLQRPTDTYIRLREDLTHQEWTETKAEASGRLCLPAVDARALNGLKFSAALPPRLAEATLAARLADLDGASAVLKEASRFTVLGG